MPYCAQRIHFFNSTEKPLKLLFKNFFSWTLDTCFVTMIGELVEIKMEKNERERKKKVLQ